MNWAVSWQNMFMPYANNKDAEQLVHACSLISIFDICCKDKFYTYNWFSHLFAHFTSLGNAVLTDEANLENLEKTNAMINEPYHEKTCLMPYANNKGAD